MSKRSGWTTLRDTQYEVRHEVEGEWDSPTLRRWLKWKRPFELGLGSKSPLMVSFPVPQISREMIQLLVVLCRKYWTGVTRHSQEG